MLNAEGEKRPSLESQIYFQRFTQAELQAKQRLWSTLNSHFFQRLIHPNASVVDLGAGHCEFINQIVAREKIAVDINPNTATFIAQDVNFIEARSDDLSSIGPNSVDVVFSSNFFEHLESKTVLLKTLNECHRILRPAGTLIVLMPNLRYLPGAYWDYFDHHLPLTHLSLKEAMSLSDFRVQKVIPRFLPYTVRGSRLPINALTIRVYLRFRPIWRLFGKQMLVIAAK
jgi:SAM-dependent methyltransferase